MEPVKQQLMPAAGSKKNLFKQVLVNDTRFGERKINLTKNETPKTFSYADPAPGWWGTR